VIVLDASAWIDVLVAGLEIPDLATDDLCVPPHFDVEVLGSLRALQHRDSIDRSQADTAAERHLRGLFDRVYDSVDLRRAWGLRAAMSFRDAWYVALTERLEARWVTGDSKAARAARGLGIATQVV